LRSGGPQGPREFESPPQRPLAAAFHVGASEL